MKKLLCSFISVWLLCSCELITDNGAQNANTPLPFSRNINQQEEQLSNNTESNLFFQSKRFHFSVQHPHCIIQDDSFGIIFQCGNEAITFVRAASIPRIPLPENQIEQITISGILAHLYHDTDQKTGANMDVVLFTIPGTTDDFSISGYGPVFKRMIQTVEIQF